MRPLAFVPLLALAACSDTAEPTREAQEPAPQILQAGQWEIIAEVTTFNKADEGAPRIDTPVGSKETSSHCIAEADVRKPAPALFARGQDSCKYRDAYFASGRISASVDCTHPGLSGQVLYNVNGTYTATTIEATRDTQTYLATDGDVRITSKITGRHVGQCTAGSDPA